MPGAVKAHFAGIVVLEPRIHVAGIQFQVCINTIIRQMFLLEAAFIGLGGGVIGNVLSFLMSAAINALVKGKEMGMTTGQISYIPLWLVLVSLGFAMLVGTAAGYFPARRAMKLSPLAAIRNE